MAGDSIHVGGNIECTPKVTVGGKGYPYGRIVIGTAPTPGVNRDGNPRVNFSTEILNFLKAQEIQDPLEVPISWADLRHIDELVSFVPNRTTPNPDDFAVLVASPAWAEVMMLLIPDASQMTVVTASMAAENKAGFPITVGDYWSNWNNLSSPAIFVPGTPASVFAGAGGIREANAIIASRVAALVADLKAGLGLPDEAFLAVPQLFTIGEELQATCAQASMANIQIVGSHALMFAFGGPNVNQLDAFGVSLHYTLNTMLGYNVHVLNANDALSYLWRQAGVHCASNLVPDLETPGVSWWTQPSNPSNP